MSDEQSDNNNTIPYEHTVDPAYGYVSNNMFNMTKWIRENAPRQELAHKVGDIVRFTCEMEVTVQAAYRDCDGTPLYRLSMVGAGWSEKFISVVEDTDNE